MKRKVEINRVRKTSWEEKKTKEGRKSKSEFKW